MSVCSRAAIRHPICLQRQSSALSHRKLAESSFNWPERFCHPSAQFCPTGGPVKHEPSGRRSHSNLCETPEIMSERLPPEGPIFKALENFTWVVRTPPPRHPHVLSGLHRPPLASSSLLRSPPPPLFCMFPSSITNSSSPTHLLPPWCVQSLNPLHLTCVRVLPLFLPSFFCFSTHSQPGILSSFRSSLSTGVRHQLITAPVSRPLLVWTFHPVGHAPSWSHCYHSSPRPFTTRIP